MTNPSDPIEANPGVLRVLIYGLQHVLVIYAGTVAVPLSRVGIGRVVFALSEKGLLEFTGNSEDNPTLDLPCREVFQHGQRKIEVEGPLLEDEAGVVHQGFW